MCKVREEAFEEGVVALGTGQTVVAFGALRGWRTQPLGAAVEPGRARERLLHRQKWADRPARAGTTGCCSRSVLVRTYRATTLRLIEGSSWALVTRGAFRDLIIDAGEARGTAVCDAEGESALTTRP